MNSLLYFDLVNEFIWPTGALISRCRASGHELRITLVKFNSSLSVWGSFSRDWARKKGKQGSEIMENHVLSVVFVQDLQNAPKDSGLKEPWGHEFNFSFSFLGSWPHGSKPRCHYQKQFKPFYSPKKYRVSAPIRSEIIAWRWRGFGRFLMPQIQTF